MKTGKNVSLLYYDIMKNLHTICIGNVKKYDLRKHMYFTLLTGAKSFVIPCEKNEYFLGSLPYSIDGQV